MEATSCPGVHGWKLCILDCLQVRVTLEYHGPLATSILALEVEQ